MKQVKFVYSRANSRGYEELEFIVNMFCRNHTVIDIQYQETENDANQLNFISVMLVYDVPRVE